MQSALASNMKELSNYLSLRVRMITEIQYNVKKLFMTKFIKRNQEYLMKIIDNKHENHCYLF